MKRDVFVIEEKYTEKTTKFHIITQKNREKHLNPNILFRKHLFLIAYKNEITSVKGGIHMEAKVHSLLEKHNLLSFEREVLDNLIPCLCLQLEKNKELPLGSSKMGGLPDLTKGCRIPLYNNLPLTFIAQYNPEEMNEVPFPTCLPAKGMLYFFYQADEQEVRGEKEHN
ncbi:hypothetical protein D1872_179670 [compost metagenome]|jgi:hypothetical protein